MNLILMKKNKGAIDVVLVILVIALLVFLYLLLRNGIYGI